MSFQPLVPIGGYAGWQFLSRTQDTQKVTFSEGPELKRDTAYFADRIAQAQTADDLVSDYRLLKVALGAFGLDEDIGNKFFIQKVLEEGTSAPDALANKLSDKRYKAMSAAFGFGAPGLARTALTGFAEEITSAHLERQFEVAVGQQDESFRLALNAQRELPEIASTELSDAGMWYSIMGSAPLRRVFEAAFGLPDSFPTLDIEQQLEVLRDRAQRILGDSTVAQFSSAERTEDLIQTFLLRSQIQDIRASLSSQSVALKLLSGSP